MDREESLYFRMTQKAQQYDYLHHFTALDKFEKIIAGQKLLLNRLDKVEDKSENKFLPELWRTKVFVGCFTHSKEGKRKFWEEYAHGNGVRLSFPNSLMIMGNYKIISANDYCFPKRKQTNIHHSKYEHDEDWAYFDISKVDILYLNQKDAEEWKGCGNGLVKNYVTGDIYDWEEETRIRVAMDPIGWENRLNREKRYEIVTPPFDKIFLEMNENILQNMFVSVPDNSTNEFVLNIRAILRLCEHTTNCKIYKLTPQGELYDTSI